MWFDKNVWNAKSQARLYRKTEQYKRDFKWRDFSDSAQWEIRTEPKTSLIGALMVAGEDSRILRQLRRKTRQRIKHIFGVNNPIIPELFEKIRNTGIIGVEQFNELLSERERLGSLGQLKAIQNIE